MVLLGLTVAIASASSAAPSVNPFAQPEQDLSSEEGSASTARNNPASELNLKAVMPSALRPLANINGQLLAPGDLYDGYTLISVSEDGVLLRRGNRTITLDLRPANPTAGSPR